MSNDPQRDLDRLAIDTIRTLAMDAVEQAKSGHPGTPMALAPVMYVLWRDFLRHDPTDPSFLDRDRFVLSAGHASMLLYATLHLFGYDVSLDDIKRFRQFGSKCAGHPEYGHCPGVETTTGPLGQGCGNSVGMAIAQKRLAARFNRPGFEIAGWRTWAIVSDGDLMEGVGHEAASLAGHLGLDNLTWIFDNNRITIEGSTELAFTEDVAARFRALGWQTWHVQDANDLGSLATAMASASQCTGKPGLIVVNSQIAFGSPGKAGTAEAHGAPLGDDEIKKTKQVYGWNPDVKFHVPAEVIGRLVAMAREKGRMLHDQWNRTHEAWSAKEPALAAEWRAMHSGGLPEGWDAELPTYAADLKGVPGRKASSQALGAIAKRVPWLIGGSADLGSSNLTLLAGESSFSRADRSGRNLHFGVRENAMAAIANGLSLSGFRAYCATFLIFSDYVRPVHRLSALMKQPVIYVYTHDSMGVGEDGPTHQPIEHLAALRAIPDLDVIRPADANEAVEAWRYLMPQVDRPVVLALSRQNLRTLDRTRYGAASGLRRGAYVLADAKDGKPDVLLMATGSEVALVVDAHDRLTAEGIKARVISMPCWSLFERQDAAWRESVLPDAVDARVAVEAASTFGWSRWVGRRGAIIGRDAYGASAPGDVLFKEFGFTVEAVVAAARSQLERVGKR